ncbi:MULTISPECIES: DNA-binding protein [unclassified Bacillus (in: firmicutes)]|uniref:DNA-binding protein n=1 Tax=unclassified Bacillus (in: firmicutes) TaxID=185979 RepID=UPI0013EE677F|nr:MULTISPECIES: DNA-binding protein [unclassified Bacillus (in: firmicutes)]KAF6602584.1 DNA-binding protein [Bacillus sp. EKM420B]KAF6607140.1 DNA-binding protein [Bacillus sp. EKM417B]WGD67857.1 DNA-binding protein [Bacillus velezensis]
MKIKMNKIHDESVKGCFCHFDNCGRLYLGRHQNDGLSFTIIDESGDSRVIHIDEQILCEDIMLFQQSLADRYVLIYFESHEYKVKVLSADGTEQCAFSLPSGVSCSLLDEKQKLWIGLSDEGIYSDENPDGHSVLCYSLDGRLKKTHIDQQLSEIYAPAADDCYALAEKDGLIYMLYYSYTVIAAFDETDVKRVWIISDKTYSGVYDQLAISDDGFWVCKDDHSLSLIPADVSLPMQEVTCCDPDGDELSGHQLKLTGNAIYVVSNSGIYKRDISNWKAAK